MTEELFRQDAYLKETMAHVIEAAPQGLIFNRTVFYPLGGGQAGDSGELVTATGARIAIVDTVKDKVSGAILHIPAEGSDLSTLAPQTEVTLKLDWVRRHRLMRMHTCLHLLSALLPYPVTGGQISDGKGRLDFDMSEAPPDKEELTHRLNDLIAAGHKVEPRWITDEELLANPDLVKTMAVKPPIGFGQVRLLEIKGADRPLDLQACGGTHVANTAEIGPVRVAKIENKGKQNRRVILEFAS